MIALIGANTKPLKTYLEENGIPTEHYAQHTVPSLTALLITTPAITSIVVMPDAQKEWSLAHALNAARQLKMKGHLIYFQGQSASPLIATPATEEALLQLLKKPSKPAAKAADTTGGKALPVKHEPPEIKPLEIPLGSILFLGIIGSQSRIGCTTQAIALWHYCKELGFDPAIVSSQTQISDIAAVMHRQEINGGYQIEGIPFVTNSSLSYDCYILDLGIDNVRETIQRSDYLFLVAGTKPWELQHTSSALRMAKGKQGSILLSFSSKKDADALAPLFEGRQFCVLPWMKDFWNPGAAVLAIYNQLFRPILMRCLTDKQQENETEYTYEEENKP